MDQQIPSSVPPQGTELPFFNTGLESANSTITPQQLEEIKKIAKKRAFDQVMQQREAAGNNSYKPNAVEQQESYQQTAVTQAENVVYVKRPLTVAEYLLIFLLASGFVASGQFIWKGLSNLNWPPFTIEIKMK